MTLHTPDFRFWKGEIFSTEGLDKVSENQTIGQINSKLALLWQIVRFAEFNRISRIDFSMIHGWSALEGLARHARRSSQVGKSWLALDIASAAASGGTVLGRQVEPGDVLLLALEDTDRRLQRRMTKVLGAYKQDWLPSRA